MALAWASRVETAGGKCPVGVVDRLGLWRAVEENSRGTGLGKQGRDRSSEIARRAGDDDDLA